MVTYDQHLVLINQPAVVTGCIRSVQIYVKLDGYWDGYEVWATFFRDDDQDFILDRQLDADGFCLVPAEMMEVPCTLNIGVWGKDEDGRVKASTMIKYRIRWGSPIEEGVLLVDARDATATAAMVLAGATFYARDNSINVGTIETYHEGDLVETDTDGVESMDIPVYSGTYEVTTSVSEDQVLETAGKYLTADIVVSKVPYEEVQNEAGGTTVNIG